MLKIRLRRMGSRHRPFYRVVVSDSRRRPTANAVEELGYYNPISHPKVIEIDTEKVDYWVNRGAHLSDSVRQLIRRAGQPAVASPANDSAPAAAAEEPKAEEAKAEEPKAEESKASEEAAATEDSGKAEGGEEAPSA